MTPYQEEAVLDLVMQCRVVRQVWEQKDTHRLLGEKAYKVSERKKVAQAIDEAWKSSMNDLARIAGDVCDTGLDSDYVINLLDRYLPWPVAERIRSAIP